VNIPPGHPMAVMQKTVNASRSTLVWSSLISPSRKGRGIRFPDGNTAMKSFGENCVLTLVKT
jgi:hypothetical protein